MENMSEEEIQEMEKNHYKLRKLANDYVVDFAVKIFESEINEEEYDGDFDNYGISLENMDTEHPIFYLTYDAFEFAKKFGDDELAEYFKDKDKVIDLELCYEAVRKEAIGRILQKQNQSQTN